jgi:predicted GTPase
MKLGPWLRRFWPETLLFVAVALPWLSLFALGLYWLWQGGHVWVWAMAAAALGLTAWPLSILVKRRATQEARLALGDLASPSRGWNAAERDAWAEVLKIADGTAPFSFTATEPLVRSASGIVETVARRFHPEGHAAWARFSLPEFLLLTEQISREVRRQALRHIPGVRAIRLNHLLWVHRQSSRYGPVAHTGWQVGFGIWRIIRAALNPVQAAGQETSSLFVENATRVLSYRLRAYATRLLVLEIGRASIDLYSGRLALSDGDLRAAQERDLVPNAEAVAPIRIVMVGQINAGKSSLLNALAQEIRCAIGPLPATASVREHLLKLDGRPCVVLVDMPGFDESKENPTDLLPQVERADLIIWVASATQPARGADRKRLDHFRAWANVQLTRRPPTVLLALTHVDELRPTGEWAPPYNITERDRPKARAIRAAMNAAARALDLPLHAIVPVAMPPSQESYNIDALWARIAAETDEARLVQLDRLRVGQQGLGWREAMESFGHAGRAIIQGVISGAR